MKSKRKRIDSDGLLQRKAGGGRKTNPFETIVMKSKFPVLNRGTQSKQPGVIRKRAIENRKQTLGKEFATLHKTNRFVDARVGRKHARQPLNTSQRKEMYNLNLTHRGQTLSEIENLDDVVDDDNDEDEESGVLHDDFTKLTHFGGGSDDEREAGGRDRNTVIKDMIDKSRRLKHEKQRDNDLVFEKSQELDKDLQLLLSQVGMHMRKENERPELDDYDRTMREMVFERRGMPAEKLKSEQLARTEQERRERLERERLERMKNDPSELVSDKTKKHLSADALDDGYLLDDDEDNAPSEEDEGIDSEANGYDPRKVSQEETDKRTSPKDDTGKESSEEDDAEGSGSDADSLSDLKNVQPSSDKEDEVQESEEEKATDPVEEEPQARVKPTAHSVAPLPRFVEIPLQYEDFVAMIEGRSVEQQAMIIEKIVQKANENNHRARTQRPVLFVYIIQHLVDRFTVSNATSVEEDFTALHLLTPLLYDIARKDRATTSEMFLDIMQEKYADFQQHPHRYPPLATLVILKLLPSLYSASDVRHPIVTPGLVFISELLTRCPVRNRRHIAGGLLLVTIVLECVEQSKRFLPAVLTFLTGVLNLACPPKSPPSSAKSQLPFKAAPALLLPAKDGAGNSLSGELKLIAEDLIRAELTESFKVRAVVSAVSMMGTLGMQLTECAAIQTIAQTFLRQLDGLEKARYPAKGKVLIKKVHRQLTELAGRPLVYLVAAEQKPKPLRLLEPKIQPVYDDIRRRPKAAVPLREQRKKLQQKVKKVARSAAREIRLDNEYISKLQHKRRMESDRERKNKVRQIFNEAASQQGDLNSLDRKAKYRNK